MDDDAEHALSKVPHVTLLFWIVKIAATTLGETGGDAFSMSLELGYLLSTAIFGALFVASVYAQIRAKAFHPALYWFTIVATTTVGTTLADYSTRDLGIGYAGGSALLVVLLGASLFVWQRSLGTISVESVATPRAEAFYWTTIMFSQTLGTALGDWTADDDGLNLGFGGATLVFGAMLAVTCGFYLWTRVSRTLLFWVAFILTRPLGATVGDLLDKPLDEGGLELSRFAASGVLIVFITVCIFAFPHRAARRAH